MGSGVWLDLPFDEPLLVVESKPLQTDFGIHHRLESCVFVA